MLSAVVCHGRPQGSARAPEHLANVTASTCPPVGSNPLSVGVHRALCQRCAKTRLFWTHFPPMARVTAVTTVFPYAELLRL